MLHVFIINPAAGAENQSDKLRDEIEAVFSLRKEKYYIFVTEYARHAAEITKDMCDIFRKETVRFYACGGRGLFSEVISGIDSVAAKNLEVAFYPIGLTNEITQKFVKEIDAFKDLKTLIDGEPVMANIMTFNNLAAMDYAWIGYSTYVTRSTRNFMWLAQIHRNLPFVVASIINIFKELHRDFFIEIDGVHYDGKYDFILAENCYMGDISPLLATFGSAEDEGSIRFRFIKANNWFSAVKIILNMRKHEFEKFSKSATVVMGKTAKISHKDGSCIMVAGKGEYAKVEELNFAVQQQAFSFVVPRR